MKTTIFSMLLLSFSVSAMASSLVVTCHSGEDKIVVSADRDDANKPQMLSIYNQGGLGPNFLDSSYLSTKGFFQISPSDSLFVEAEFPFGGKFQVEFLETFSNSTGKGMMIYPNEKSVTTLDNCQLSIK